MSREVKVGLLAVICIFLSIWGYKFLKGHNVFENSNTFYATFSDVTGLAPSSSVLMNGYKIGQVRNIELHPDDMKKMNVFFNIDGDIPLPKNSRVIMKSEGIMGGKYITIEFDKPCSGADCAVSGDKLEGVTIGLLGSMLGEDDVSSYVGEVSSELEMLIKSIGSDNREGKIDDIVRNLDATLKNFTELSAASTRLIERSNKSLLTSLDNLHSITKNIADNNAHIGSMISNLNAVIEGIKTADVGKAINSSTTVMDNAAETIKKLENTIVSLETTISNISEITQKINGSDGSLGKLMNDKKLYDYLTETSRNLNLLLQDLRLNPKRYFHLSVFGKKQRKYTLPEEDPQIIK